jgi:hypothetical protein
MNKKRNMAQRPTRSRVVRDRHARPEWWMMDHVAASEVRPRGGQIRGRTPIRTPPSCHSQPRPAAAIRKWGYVCLFLVLSLAGILSARYGSSVTSSVNRGTVPPSRSAGGLTTTPNPLDDTGNAVVTGNVSGGRAFRANVPYNSTTSFNARLGSTSLDSFRRDSAGPEEFGDGSGGYTPFYSATGTVSKMQPGSGSPRVANGTMQYRPEQPADLMAVTEAPLAGRLYSAPAGGAPQWSRTPEEMQRIVAGEPGSASSPRVLGPQGGQGMNSEEYRQQLAQLQRDFDRVRGDASRFDQDLRTGRSTFRPAQQPAAIVPVRPMLSPEAVRRIILPESLSQEQSATINPALNQDLPPGSLTPGQDEAPTTAPTPGDNDANSRGLILFSPPSASGGAAPSLADALRPELSGPPTPDPNASDLADQKERIADVVAPRTGANPAPVLSAPPRAEEAPRTVPPDVLGNADAPGPERPKDPGQTGTPAPPATQPPTLDPVSQEKFDRLMQSAQADMHQGSYQRAAESFALAAVYNPRDVRPTLGRSHALLAAGEFPNSAFCLAKALELDPRTTLAKSDLVEAVGGPDQFVRQVTRLEDLAKTNSAPGLQLLLAYIYQQSDRPEEAKAALQAARQGLPSSPSLDRLEAALNAPR